MKFYVNFKFTLKAYVESLRLKLMFKVYVSSYVKDLNQGAGNMKFYVNLKFTLNV